MNTTRTLIATGLLTLAGASFAHGSAPQHGAYDQLERRQEQRIQQGLSNGSLTAQEAHQLYAAQARIDQLERLFRTDGRLSEPERQYLVRMQQEAGQHIFHEKHDRQVAWFGR